MTYEEWAYNHPQAAADLQALLLEGINPPAADDADNTEDWAQQQVRMQAARAGGVLWRNNVGATPTKAVHLCPKCSFKFEVVSPPLRYGLCNDSTKLNKKLKSSDLIGIMPLHITQAHVGQTVGQFVAVEMKRPNWKWGNSKREVCQAAFLALVQSKGGAGKFSIGELF